MEPGPSQSTTTTAPPSTNAELQVSPTEPLPGNPNADPDDPEGNHADAPLPLGVKLTGYTLLNIVVMFTIGVAKFILSLDGHSIAPTGLEWAGGSVLAIFLYWIGLYEKVEPPRWRCFFHVDWAPAIGFGSKCFLGGVLFSLASAWEYLPLILVIIIYSAFIPFFYSSILGIVGGLVAEFLVFLLCKALPTEWRVWQKMPVWAPVKPFFHRYGSGSGNSAGGQYRLIGNVGFCFGVLSGPVLSFVFGYYVPPFVSHRLISSLTFLRRPH